MTDVDVLVAGGGPVGLAAAIEARLAGLSVAVLEPRVGPVDKACGEGLMPGAVRALRRLGVSPTGHAVTGIRYVDGSQSVEHRFRHGPGLGVRRTALTAALAARAQEAGALLLAGRVGAVDQDAHGVTAGGLRGCWLLACDGLHSPVRRAVGLDRPVAGNRRFGLRRHFAIAPWTDLVEVHWSAQVEAYVTPVDRDVIGVAVLGPPRPYRQWVDDLPGLAARLEGAPPLTPVRGAGPLRQRAARRTAGRVLLVGDAAGYVDALTGEGLRVGLAEARAAVAAVSSGQPLRYERAWSRTTRSYRLLTGGLLAAASRPAVRSRIVPAAARLPSLFGAAVEALAS